MFSNQTTILQSAIASQISNVEIMPNDNIFEFAAALATIKFADPAKPTSWAYALAWTTQINRNLSFLNGDVYVQWFSAKWNTNGYVNYICSSTYSGYYFYPITYSMTSTTSDL